MALLANFGIEVSEGLVSKVKIESLKKSQEIKRHEEKLKITGKRQRKPMNQKKP